MNEIDINWEDLKLFLAVARAGGLSAAEHSSGKSAPTLGRRLLALEKATGQELFLRLPRGYALTNAGELLLQKVLQVETQISDIGSFANSNKKVLVKISAGNWMTQALMQHTDQLLQNNATAQLRFIAAEQVLNINHRETIIGVRNQRPEQLDLACRKTGKVQFAVYARTPKIKRWAKVVAQTPTARWLEQQSNVEDAIELSSPRSALDLALAGRAKALLPTFIGDAEPCLQLIGGPIPELCHDQWLVSHPDERHRIEVRRTIDQLYGVCRTLLASSTSHVRP